MSVSQADGPSRCLLKVEKKDMFFQSCFLGGGNSNIFYFHPYLGKIPILTNIFQWG